MRIVGHAASKFRLYAADGVRPNQVLEAMPPTAHWVTGSLCRKLVALHIAVGLGSKTPLLYTPRLTRDQ
jgi:hypothetical protein